MERDMWISGNWPFCGDNEAKCGLTPGFKCIGKSKGSGLKRCWTGQKAHCQYDFNTFRQTDLYQKLKSQNNGVDFPEFFPNYKWFGTAPFCMPSKNELADEDYVMVAQDKCGDGHCCVTGKKLLGMKPVTQAQQQELEEAKQQAEQDRQRKQQIIDKALNAVQVIGDVGSKVGSLIPGVGPAVKVVSDGINVVTNLFRGGNGSNPESTKATGYNDSSINADGLTRELKSLSNKESLAKYDKDYLRRYSIISDIYARLSGKEVQDENDRALLAQLEKFMEDIKRDKHYTDLNLRNQNLAAIDRSTKGIVAELQKKDYQNYLTSLAKDYLKFKNIANTLPVGQ